MPESQSDIDAKIDELTETLQTGETSTTIDGTTTQADLESCPAKVTNEALASPAASICFRTFCPHSRRS